MVARAFWCLGFAACISGGDDLAGLARTPDDVGPLIRWQPAALPLPDIPFPNDLATRPDPASPTLQRLNVATLAPTRHEARLRRLINSLDGFGTYAPLWLAFEGRIDVADLHARHDDVDVENDAIYLVNLEPKSSHFGERALLDVGSGRFPLGLERPAQFFDNDPRAGASNVIFETAAEDLDLDGVLSVAEDTDDDGVLDVPNTWGTLQGDATRQDPFDDLLTFYELETDTLLLRPVLPLDELSTYAVIVTRRLRGANGSPVRSPFEWVNHVQQTAALAPLRDGVLARHGLTLDDVAFAWTFTTQSVTRDLAALREGLYGRGVFGRLAAQFPPRLSRVVQADEPELSSNIYLLDVARLVAAFESTNLLSLFGQSQASAEPLKQSYRDHVQALVFAELESPAFIENDTGTFALDWQSGRAAYEHGRFQVLCSIPKPRNGRSPPYPVIVYAHGTGSSRLEMLGYAGFYAGFGFATCAIDAYAHGLPDSPDLRLLAEAAMRPQRLERVVGTLFTGRAVDQNSDGVADPGGGYWTANSFHTRDVVRQTLVDHFQLVRVLRAFGRETMPVDVNGDGIDELAGDFDGDGVADLGGEQDTFMTGASLGGIITSLVGALEPSLVALAPGSAGAGLSDIAVRSVQAGAMQAIWLPILGPLIVGGPTGTVGRIELSFDILDVTTEAPVPFARVPRRAGEEGLSVGDRIRAINLDNGEQDEVHVRAPDTTGAQVRLHLPADKFDRVVVELFHAGATQPFRRIETFELEARFQGRTYAVGEPLRLLQEGFGMRRGSPAVRRLTALAQMAVEPADPANYAPLWATKNVLMILTPGDMNVPISTGVALARTAGFFDPQAVEPRYGVSVDTLLRDTHVLEGLEERRHFERDPCHYTPGEILFDVDAVSEGLDAEQGPMFAELSPNPACDGTPAAPLFCATACSARPPLRLTVNRPGGRSGVRFPSILPEGIHSFDLPDPTLDFDYHLYTIRQIGWFLATGGRELIDAPCLASHTAPCAFLPVE